MLNRLAGFFRRKQGTVRKTVPSGSDRASTGDRDDFRILNAVALLASEIEAQSATTALRPADNDETTARKTIVCREALLGKDQRVAGYAFKLPHKVRQRVRASSDNIHRLYDEVLLRNLQGMDIPRLLEQRIAIVDVSASSLAMPVLEALFTWRDRTHDSRRTPTPASRASTR